MSITAYPPTNASGNDEYPNRRRWTREEYYRAGELGLFGPEERLELIRGDITVKERQSPAYATAAQLCTATLRRAFSRMQGAVWAQRPMSLPNASEFEPDILVTCGGIHKYVEHHPTHEEALLVVEVSDKTLAFDLGTKAALYAEAGIPDYWVLNVRARRLEVRRDPVDGVYQTQLTLQEGESVTPLFAPNSSIQVSALFSELDTPEENKENADNV
jgi:Uma2 family endonuclease